MTDNSVIVNPNAKINVTSSHHSLQELPIGGTIVVVTARDCAGNVASCSFHLEIRGLVFIYKDTYIYFRIQYSGNIKYSIPHVRCTKILT